VPHIEILDDKHLLVQTVWTEKEMVKEIPGARWDSKASLWTIPKTWAAVVQARGVFGETLTSGPLVTKWAWQEVQSRVQPAKLIRDNPGDLTVPYDFQNLGTTFLEIAGNALLADEMGTGKTKQSLKAIKHLPAVVICPNSTKHAWANQVYRWRPDLKPIIIEGGAQKREKLFKQAKETPNAIVIINIEAVRGHSKLGFFPGIALQRCRTCDPRTGNPQLSAARCHVHPKTLNGFGFQTVIVDEAHNIKSPSAIQTRAIWAVGHDESVRQRIALTGTPIANNPADLWSIMHFLEPDEFPTRGAFIDRYCLQAWNGWGGMDIVGVRPDHRDEFFKIIDPRLRRMPKALVLPQLPRKVYSRRNSPMIPKQTKIYNEISTGLISMVDGVVMIARNNLEAQIRLVQLASSYCEVEWIPDPTDEDPDNQKMLVHPKEPSNKLDVLDEIHDELGDQQYVVSAMHKKIIMLAAERYKKRGIEFGLITGDQSPWERQQFLQAFIDGRIQVIFFTVGAGGTGVDGLQTCDTMVRLQRPWSMIDNKQATDRVHRIGSEVHDRIHIIDIVTPATVEEEQIDRLLTKEARLEEIMRDRETVLKNGGDVTLLDNEVARILNSNLGEG
jgi:SNF2 family DNA or RNA helicase